MRLVSPTQAGGNMSLIIWRDDYSCGHELIDTQHQNMVELINQLHAESYLGSASKRMQEYLNFLLKYTCDHFLLEENLMVLHQLPMEASHRQEHANFRNLVEICCEDFKHGRCDAEYLLNVLQSWFIDHMTGTDKITFAGLASNTRDYSKAS
ncbi:MAG: hemerythrin family protein [Okeania sp. SIO3B3]|nr:hemerythrin family protein [Okeania sp. SIO3B3]